MIGALDGQEVKLLRLTVMMPTETLLEVEGVAWVQAHLADVGGIGIWPGHAPLVGETVRAPLRYADESGVHTLDLEAGILQIDRAGVIVLTRGTASGDDGTDEEAGQSGVRVHG